MLEHYGRHLGDESKPIQMFCPPSEDIPGYQLKRVTLGRVSNTPY